MVGKLRFALSGIAAGLALASSAASQGEIIWREKVDAAESAGLLEKVKSGEIEPEDIDEELFNEQLYTADSPDVDLLIRTSGEERLSNFLPWQTVYAEFVFDTINWPDFDRARYMKCLRVYADRDRRFGGVKAAQPETASDAATSGEV